MGPTHARDDISSKEINVVELKGNTKALFVEL